MKDDILPSLPNSFESVECVKGNLTKTNRNGSYRSSNLPEIIHIDSCGPFSNTILNGLKYFLY